MIKNPYQRLNSCNMFLKLLLMQFLVIICRSNTIAMNITSTNLFVGSTSDITITLDRTTSRDGTSVTPTSIGTANYIILVSFDLTFTLSNLLTSVTNATSYTISANDRTISIAYNSTLYGANFINFTIRGVQNPVVSVNPLAIYVKISDANNIIKDDAYNSLTFIKSTLSSSNINWSFNPRNVSTISNLTFVITTSLYNAGSGMYMEVNFRRWWARSQLNTTASTIFSSSSTCSPICTLNLQSSATMILFSNSSLSLSYNSSSSQLAVVFIGLQSPPSLQLIDLVQIIIRQPQYRSIVQQSDGLLIGGQAPNSLESKIATTTNTINQIISLSIQVSSRNIFGPNDTLTIVLANGSELASTSSVNINFQSFLITSFITNVQDLNTIVFSSFTFISANLAPLNALITFNRIVQASSTKPRNNNKIQLRRNGFLFNADSFSYSVVESVVNSFAVSLDNNYANNNAVGAWKVILSKGVVPKDKIFMSIPQAISVSSCQPQCSQCTCSFILPTVNTPYTQIVINMDNLAASSLIELTIITNHKNPISQGVNISICSTDSQNYTKQCGTTQYPQIIQASLSSQTLSLSFSNSVVYSISNYTFYYNFTNYDLQSGYLITIIPVLLKIVDPSRIVCRVNNQPQCIVSINGSGTYINTTVSSSTKIYTIVLNNIKNPSSTRPFLIEAKVAYISGEFYYSIQSDYYNMTTPYTLQNITHFNYSSSNCKNSQVSNLTVKFVNSNLPFSLKTQFPNQNLYYYRVTNIKTGAKQTQSYTLSSSVLPDVLFYHKNWYSYQPISYIFQLYSGNLLYLIWQFTVVQQNCQPQLLPLIGYQFTGLPEDSGTLMIAYTHEYSSYILPTNSQYSIKLTFPNEYPLAIQPSTNAALFSISSISSRVFTLKVLSNQQPIIIQLTNFTNAINTNLNSGYTNNGIAIEVFDNSYLIAGEYSSIKYRLSDITSCSFPCKLCASGNGVQNGTCIACYSSALTPNYLLWNNNSATNSVGTCVSSCPSTTYLNSAAGVCSNCPVSCKTCVNDSYCNDCSSNYYFYQHACVTDCPNGFYPSTIEQTCNVCAQPCLNCVNSTFCKSCIAGYYLYLGSCVSSCPIRYIPQSVSNIQICYFCSSPCLLCSQSLTNCTQCISSYYLTNNNSCVTQCTDPQIGYLGVCTNCASNCYRCLQAPTKCTACTGQLKLYNNTCISNCPAGYYVTTANSSSVCSLCPAQCSVCTSSSNCSQCNSGFIFYQSACISNCPISMYISNLTVTNNSTNSSYIFKQCKSCAVSTCLSCPSGPALCVACLGGYYLYQMTCVQTCPTATFVQGSNCSACPVGCLTCLSLIQCTSCTSAYSLYQNSCLTSCPSNMVSVNNVCKNCIDVILNCLSCSILGCNECSNGYYLFSNSSNATQIATCLSKCPSGYIQGSFNGSNKCLKCDSQCLTCTGSVSNCTQCVSGYLYYSNNCLLSCPSKTTAINNECFPCAQPCLSCSHNSTSFCQSCISNKYLINFTNSKLCVDSCPQGYYSDNSSYRCVACPTGCANCIQQGCLTCLSTYFAVSRAANNLTLYDCVLVCPTHLPFIISINICSACSNHCIQCQPSPNFKCLQCEQPYIRYSQYCIETCPYPYVVQNRQCIQPENKTDNNSSSDNTTNSTANTTISAASAPVPFTITSVVMGLLVVVSRVQFSWSSVTMGLLAFNCLLVPICDIVSLSTIWSNASTILTTRLLQGTTSSQIYPFTMIALYLIIVGLGLIYISNIFHAIFGHATFRKDPLFQKYSLKHKITNKILFALSIIFQHLFFVAYFCRFFNFSCFRAWLQNTHCLNCLNYVWGLALVGNILGIVAGIIIIVKNSYFLYAGIDLVFVNSIVLITGLLLMKKSRGSGWIREDYVQKQGYEVSDDDYSTKKVVMLNQQGDSDAQIGNIYIDTIEENFGKSLKKLQTSNINDINEEDKHQKNNDGSKLKQGLNPNQNGQFYFEQPQGDNCYPQIPINKQEDEKGNEQQQNGSESTDPLRIQPSINMLVTADEMKPGEPIQNMKQKGDIQYQTNKSMGWSSISRQGKDKILPKQNKIDKQGLESPLTNIFGQQYSHIGEQEQKQISKKSNEQLQYFFIQQNPSSNSNPKNNSLKSKSSIKSLKGTHGVNKKQQQLVGSPTNLAAKGLNKSRKLGGGRSSQQFVGSNNKQKKHQDNNIKNNSGRQSDDGKRIGSRASQRKNNEHQMGIIQEEMEQNYNQKNNVQKIVLRGTDRFMSNTLVEDNKLDAVSQFQQSEVVRDRSKKSIKFSPRRSSRLMNKSIQQRSNSRGESRSTSRNKKNVSPRISSQLKQSKNHILNINETSAAKQEQIMEMQQIKEKSRLGGQEESKINQYTFANNSPQMNQLNANKDGSQSITQTKQIQGAKTIFVEYDQDQTSRNQQHMEKGPYFLTYNDKLKQFHTISQDINVAPVSMGNLPKASKLKALKLKGQVGKESENPRQEHDKQKNKSVPKRHLKSFRSKNVSVDKLRPSTSQFKYRLGREQDEQKINVKQVMRQIQRKQKIRSQQESLNKIYLKR